jgi:lipid II:glycine glycyltransferase (peptidoglycan interpeptide bridge formation enzyme)
LIRQAQKNEDIEIFQSQKIADIEIFNNLYQEVVKLQHFVPFSYEYLKNEFSAFQPDNQISLFFGKYKGEIIASAFVLFWSKIGFYHHAALLPKYHKIPIAYSLLWEAIREAKKGGCILYDFWGYVNPKENPEHPWAGPTLFKMGFGGRPYEYVKTQDLPLSWKYWLTYLFEKLRKTKRGL